jgi:hypothetical protein
MILKINLIKIIYQCLNFTHLVLFLNAIFTSKNAQLLKRRSKKEIAAPKEKES